MNLKSSTKTDVNMTELVVEIVQKAFEKAVEAAYQLPEEEHLYAGIP